MALTREGSAKGGTRGKVPQGRYSPRGHEPTVAPANPIRDKGRNQSTEPAITTNPYRSKYFARAVVYAKRGDAVVVVDMHDASVTEPLEPWLGKILLLADGSHTVQELIEFVGKSYPGGPPPPLEGTIDSVIERLYASDTIVFTDEPVTLPYYLALPADEQDPELANRLILEDGFQQQSKPL